MNKAQKILSVLSMFGGPSLADFLPKKRSREDEPIEVAEAYKRKAEEKRLRKAEKRRNLNKV